MPRPIRGNEGARPAGPKGIIHPAPDALPRRKALQDGNRGHAANGRTGAFTSAEVVGLEAAQGAGRPLLCPRCATPLDARPVHPPETVSYVRSRLVVVCPGCRGHGALDLPRRGP